jgi:hypothetical protein
MSKSTFTLSAIWLIKRKNMIKKNTLVCVNYLGRECAMAKVIDMQHQVIISLLERDGDHVTLHSQRDEPNILMTYHSKNKPSTKSDPIKVELAKLCGWKNPERHAQYYVHQELVTEHLTMPYISFNDPNTDLKECLAPFITFNISFMECRHHIPKKYCNLPRVTLRLSSCEFKFFMYFTKNKSEFEGKPLVPIETSLGFISFTTGEKEYLC